jgi:hypothetical protein
MKSKSLTFHVNRDSNMKGNKRQKVSEFEEDKDEEQPQMELQPMNLESSPEFEAIDAKLVLIFANPTYYFENLLAIQKRQNTVFQIT